MNYLFIVPCYNESKRWNKAYWEEMVSIIDTFWVFVDDGSTDNTQNLINGLKLSNTKLIKMSKNCGKSEAIRMGVVWSYKNLFPEFESIGYVDSDGAINKNDIEHFNKVFAEKYKANDYISLWASRVALSGRKINRNPVRHILGRVVSLIVSARRNNIAYDTQCGLKYFPFDNRTMALFEKKFKTRWFLDIEVFIRFTLGNQKQMKIWEEPLMYWDEIPGSKINLNQIYVVFKELIYIKYMQYKIQKFS
jgi:glycosyltransferase involved in cell wall biosynthesis